LRKGLLGAAGPQIQKLLLLGRLSAEIHARFGGRAVSVFDAEMDAKVTNAFLSVFIREIRIFSYPDLLMEVFGLLVKEFRILAQPLPRRNNVRSFLRQNEAFVANCAVEVDLKFFKNQFSLSINNPSSFYNRPAVTRKSSSLRLAASNRGSAWKARICATGNR